MRILIVGNYLPDKQESMQRFASMLVSGLTEQGHEVRTTRPPVVTGKLVNDSSPFKKWLGYIDKLILFPHKLRKISKWADVVHVCDHSNSMYSTSINDKPVIVTCHDMMAVHSALGEFPENSTGLSGRIYQWLIRRGLKKSPVIVCVSKATRDDVARIIGKDKNDLHVVYNGLNYPYKPMDVESIDQHFRALGLSREHEFLLHIGGNQWYKNRIGVLHIYRELLNHSAASNLYLILAGKTWTEDIKNFIRKEGIEDRVIELTDVSNEQLRAMYSEAKGLLFPSLCEGFGWPVIEAQACGCPVFTTNQAPMSEVGGDAAIYINPLQPEQAAEQISTAILNNEIEYKSAIDNAARFAPDKMIDGYITVYKDTLDTFNRGNY
jgi:glycosyltransferase involved in cell wall biosynthesis